MIFVETDIPRKPVTLLMCTLRRRNRTERGSHEQGPGDDNKDSSSV